MASLLTLSTSLRAHLLFRPIHDAWATGLHVIEDVLWHLVKLAVATATEEG